MSTTARELKIVVEARSYGWLDPVVAALADHLRDHPNDAGRAFAIAEAVNGMSGSTALLKHLLDRFVTVDQFVAAAARSVGPTWRLPPTADRAIRATLTGG